MSDDILTLTPLGPAVLTPAIGQAGFALCDLALFTLISPCRFA